MSGCLCCGKCCRNHTILITFQDVYRILQKFNSWTEHDLIDFLMIYTVTPDNMEKEVLTNYPQIEIVDKDENFSGFLGLRMKENKDGVRTCHFFNEKDNLCSIHNFKPLICQIFPFRLNDSNNAQVYSDRTPHDWNLTKIDLVKIEQLIQQAIKENNLYHNQVKGWNSSSHEKTIEMFFKFLFSLKF